MRWNCLPPRAGGWLLASRSRPTLPALLPADGRARPAASAGRHLGASAGRWLQPPSSAPAATALCAAPYSIPSRPAARPADVNLDIRRALQVAAWGSDGTAPRPTAARWWTAQLAPDCGARGQASTASSRPSKATGWCLNAGLVLPHQGSLSKSLPSSRSSPASSSSAPSRCGAAAAPGWSSGSANTTLTPGLKFVVPFIGRVAARHSLKEVPLDVPSQVCITKDNPAAGRRHHLRFQITDPMRAATARATTWSRSRSWHRRCCAA